MTIWDDPAVPTPDPPAAVPARQRVPRARMYTRLLWAIPGMIMLCLGLWRYLNTQDDGMVNAVRLSTKSGLVGEAAEAVQLIKISSPDLYLKVREPTHTFKTDIFSHTPVGDGLTWKLPKALAVREVREVEIWDHHAVLSDKMQDHISLNPELGKPAVWEGDGQTFHIELQGTKVAPERWALPLAIVGAVISLLVFLRFVWDQAI